MPNEFLGRLADARGESCQVMAIFIDVRGFSSFAGVAESTDTAQFLRTVYTSVAENHFPDADFLKPTGDGLMIITELDHDADSVLETVRTGISRSLKLVKDFAEITKDDLLINIPVPSLLGVGIARGSATKLVSADGVVIDYSGRCLNLAARLMDFGRPSGVAFQDLHAKALMGDELVSELQTKSVFVRGIAETESLEIWVSKQVSIRPEAMVPPASTTAWDDPSTLVAGLIRKNKDWTFPLTRKPRPGVVIKVRAEFDVYEPDGKEANIVQSFEYAGTYSDAPSGPHVKVNFGSLPARLDEAFVPDEVGVIFTPYH